MVNNSVYTNELNALNANIITIINKLKNQNKRADIDSIHSLLKLLVCKTLLKKIFLRKYMTLKLKGKL